MSGFIFYLIQIFITEDLALHGEDIEEGEKSFFAEGSSSISIARRVMSFAGWGEVCPPNHQMRLEAKSPG
jgi:hypothetical protein